MGGFGTDGASAPAADPTISTVCAAAGANGPGSRPAADAAASVTRVTRLGPGDGRCDGDGSAGPVDGLSEPPPDGAAPAGAPVPPLPPEPPCCPDPPDGLGALPAGGLPGV